MTKLAMENKEKKRTAKKCIKKCGRSTRNRFGICDACRQYILTGVDSNYVGAMMEV
jgi:hypothetical protein